MPAILEYLPYRHRDGTWDRDALTHPWFAAHGYAGVRVDLRGSGESDGLLFDEYAPPGAGRRAGNHRLDRQPALVLRRGRHDGHLLGRVQRVAGRRAVGRRRCKAIITVCSTDDRYADDVHFMGGALLTSNFGWGFALQGIIATPPDPALVGDAWRAMWRERLEAMPLFAAPWLRHQSRDAYWRHGSVCEDWAAIACPVFAVGGWTDAYTNAIPRMLANLRVPRQALIGPWAHKYPHIGVPGPAAGFLQEALAWWDRWLKDTNDAAPPMLRAWIMESVRPAPMYAERPGRWVAETAWPPRSVTPRRLFLAEGGLGETPDDGRAVAIHSPQHLGGTGGNWCPFGMTPDDADDQRDDDALSAVWDSAPLAERVEILGAPELELEVICDAPLGNLIARLCDVHPDGASLRVSYGVLNLAHGIGRVRLRLNDTGFAFPSGHRIRIALSTAYWPIVWPSPTAATVTVRDASLALPIRVATDAAVTVPPPETATPAARTVLREGRSIRERGRDIGAGDWFWRAVETPSRIRIVAIGTEIEMESRTEYRIRDDDPLSARMETERVQTILRGTMETRTILRAHMEATETTFVVDRDAGGVRGRGARRQPGVAGGGLAGFGLGW